MYDMYPDTWTFTDVHRPSVAAVDVPRRRVRKEHSVLPAVVTASVTGGPAAQVLDRSR
jgi:hypothetical protein